MPKKNTSVKPAKKQSENQFVKQISERIKAAKTMEELEALTGDVLGIWGDEKSVPKEVQALAAKRAEEIENPGKEVSEPVLVDEGFKDPDDWIKVTMEEMKEAEKAGTLQGFNPDTMFALISK